jgi:hypothetical protein
LADATFPMRSRYTDRSMFAVDTSRLSVNYVL